MRFPLRRSAALAASPLLLVPLVGGFQLPPSRPATSRLRSSVAEGSPVDAAADQQQQQQQQQQQPVDDAPSPVATPPSPPPPPDMTAYARGYKTAFSEVSCSLVSPSRGSLPSDLVGTYYRAGPAMFSAGSLPPPKNSLVKPKSPPVPDGEDEGRMVGHPFEGDGAVLAVTFHGDGRVSAGGGGSDEDGDVGRVDATEKATARFRYVRTNAFTNERKRGKKLYAGMEGTRLLGAGAGGGIGNDLSLPFYRHHLLPGLNKLRKNTSNTSVLYHANKLLALWGGGLPYKLDALALSTDGRSQLGGVVEREEAGVGGRAARDAARDRVAFFGIDEDPAGSALSLYEFDSKFRPVKDPTGRFEKGVVKAKLPGLALVYDFAVTDKYAVFVQPEVKVNGMQYMLSKEPGKTAALAEEGSLVHLVARVGNENAGEVKTFRIPYDGVPDANLQFVNAYEEEDGTVVFDAIRSDGRRNGSSGAAKWPWASTLEDFRSATPKKSLWRYRVHPRKGFVSRDRVVDDQTYFGTVNPDRSGRRHRYVYAAVGALGGDVAPPQGIARIDVDGGTTESWFPEAHEFCGEPVYASRRRDDDGVEEGSPEDRGYILSVLFDGASESSSLIVLRADDVASGPIARVPIGAAVPHGLHGCFAPSSAGGAWTFEEIERRAKLADKMEARGSMWNEVKSDFSGLGLRFDDMEEYFGDLM